MIAEKHFGITYINKKIVFLVCAMFVIFGIGIVSGWIVFENKPEQEISKVSELSFKDVGKLVTQEAYITMVESKYANQYLLPNNKLKAPFTESVCVFSLDFKITAEYDFENITPVIVEPSESGKGKIEIVLPEIEINTLLIPDGEKVYYEKESIFKNISENEMAEVRANMAVKAEEQAMQNGLKENAEANAKKMLETFVHNFYKKDKYDVVISVTEAKNE